MAIVINANDGTISGVAVGGLPDGIVDAGTLATNSVDSAELIDGSIDTAHIATDQITSAILPAGSVLQVVSTTKTDTFTTASTSLTDITGLTVDITPSATSSKILVLSSVNGSQDVAANRVYLKLFRDSTEIFVGDTAASRLRGSGSFASSASTIADSTISATYLDSPSSTSALTYKWQIIVAAGTGSAYINRTEADADEAGQIRMASTITVMEIAG